MSRGTLGVKSSLGAGGSMQMIDVFSNEEKNSPL